jgi:hypothetical protein
MPLILWGEQKVKKIPMSALKPDFVTPVPEEILQRVAGKIRERNIETLIVNNGDEARQVVLERLPKGAEVHSGKSKTLLDAGIFDAIQDPGQYNALRHKTLKMDRKTQGNEIRRLIAAPDFMLGSVQAITEDGILVIVSATASQIGPYANTAGKVILVAGSQKIVPDLDTAFRRIREHVQPWEEEQVQKAANIGTFVGKILIIEREWVKDRMTLVLVRESIGI